MSKSIKKIAALICSIATVASIASVSVSACKGYGDYDLDYHYGYWAWVDDSSTAWLSRCDCNMVKNNLMVWLHVQYEAEGGSYDWTPGPSTYYFDHNQDCDRVSTTITEHRIKFSEANFYAECGKNDPTDPPFIDSLTV